jgi:predicted GNAT family acetyltransferase
MTMEVVHNIGATRFEVHLEGRLAVCAYQEVDGVVHLTHTEVPPTEQGRGVAAALVAAALDWARREGKRVRPRCSYVAAYMRRHPETQDLL